MRAAVTSEVTVARIVSKRAGHATRLDAIKHQKEIIMIDHQRHLRNSPPRFSQRTRDNALIALALIVALGVFLVQF